MAAQFDGQTSPQLVSGVQVAECFAAGDALGQRVAIVTVRRAQPRDSSFKAQDRYCTIHCMIPYCPVRANCRPREPGFFSFE